MNPSGDAAHYSSSRDNEMKPLLLKVSEVCRLLQLGRARVYEMVDANEIGHIRDRKSIRIPREAVDAWIRRKRRQSGC